MLDAQHAGTQATLAELLHLLQGLNRKMAAASIFTMASGGAAPAFRCYLHGQTEAGARLLVELLLNQSSGSVQLTIKGEDDAVVPLLMDKVKAVLSAF